MNAFNPFLLENFHDDFEHQRIHAGLVLQRLKRTIEKSREIEAKLCCKTQIASLQTLQQRLKELKQRQKADDILLAQLTAKQSMDDPFDPFYV